MSEELNSEGLFQFVEKFLSEGEAFVKQGVTPEPDDAALDLLATWEQKARLELAGEAPAFVPEAAGWAATMIYSACQFVVCREVGAAEMATAFARQVPVPRSPSTDWSVDIVFRQLPEVFRQAGHLSPTDPLVQELLRLGATWPLSSVGIGGLKDLDLNSFVEHATLRQLYADRILASGDVSRLGDPRTDALLREALGAYHELCPEVARRLFPEEGTPSHSLSKL